MARPKSQRGAAAVAALRERQRQETELLSAWADADSEVADAERRLGEAVRARDTQLVRLAEAIGGSAACELTGQSTADLRRARAAGNGAAGDGETGSQPDVPPAAGSGEAEPAAAAAAG